MTKKKQSKEIDFEYVKASLYSARRSLMGINRNVNQVLDEVECSLEELKKE